MVALATKIARISIQIQMHLFGHIADPGDLCLVRPNLVAVAEATWKKNKVYSIHVCKNNSNY